MASIATVHIATAYVVVAYIAVAYQHPVPVYPGYARAYTHVYACLCTCPPRFTRTGRRKHELGVADQDGREEHETGTSGKKNKRRARSGMCVLCWRVPGHGNAHACAGRRVAARMSVPTVCAKRARRRVLRHVQRRARNHACAELSHGGFPHTKPASPCVRVRCAWLVSSCHNGHQCGRRRDFTAQRTLSRACVRLGTGKNTRGRPMLKQLRSYAIQVDALDG